MTVVADYGAGNLKSVKNALDFLGESNKISAEPEDILSADRLILPGVGAFGDAMARLRESGLDSAIKKSIASGVPFLGICLGMQLLFEYSDESPGVKGLGILSGGFERIPSVGGIKIPHIGWNSIETVKESRILHDLGDEPFVYFVHSYYLKPQNAEDVSAYTVYGERLAVAAERDNIMATQFHPEKSGEVGMKILKSFIALK